MHGKLELDLFLKLKELLYLDLSFNKLSISNGKNSCDVTDSHVRVFILASCNLVEIPTFITDLSDLEALVMSNNITLLPTQVTYNTSKGLPT